MGTVEKQRKLQDLEERFNENKRQIHRQQEEIDHQLVNFRKETGQLVQKSCICRRMIIGITDNSIIKWRQ
ncbi:hypothetical protein SNF32_15210 [Enterococcus mundtii]|nr:hypothetical protein [Enterococcus mundtii]